VSRFCRAASDRCLEPSLEEWDDDIITCPVSFSLLFVVHLGSLLPSHRINQHFLHNRSQITHIQLENKTGHSLRDSQPVNWLLRIQSLPDIVTCHWPLLKHCLNCPATLKEGPPTTGQECRECPLPTDTEPCKRYDCSAMCRFRMPG
jgi:hypothetical protein